MEDTSSVVDTTGTELPQTEETVTAEVPQTEETVTAEVPQTEETVTAEVPQTESTDPVYITSLEELLNTRGAITRQENTDKTSLLSVFQPSPSTLKNRLIVWASLGFPAYWTVFTTQINPPSVCSDGETRGFYPYLLFLLNNPESVYLSNLNTQVPGVTFSSFIGQLNTIGLSVIKS
jgi:hypothetical protein